MSEKKPRKSDSNIYAYNAHDSDEPLVKVLERIASRDPARYRRPDQSTNKMRLTHDTLIVGARKICTDANDTEGLRLLDEHEHLMATRAALREGKPLPSAIVTPPQPSASAPVSTETQTSATQPTEATPAPATSVTPVAPAPIPKPPEQKKPKRIVELVIGESGHSRVRKVTP